MIASLPPDSLRTIAAAYDVDAYAAKYAKHDAVFLKSSDAVEHSFNKQVWNAYRTSHLRFMILNDDAERWTTFTVVIDPGEELQNAFVNVLSPDGAVASYTMADMKRDEDSDGEIIYRFAYPNVEKGTIIDEGYDIRYADGSDLARWEHPLQYDVPCEEVEVRFIYPNVFGVKQKRTSPKDYPASRTESAKNIRTLIYRGKDLPALADEPYSPNLKEMSDYFEVAITSYNGAPFNESWREMADEFKEYFLDRESFWRDRAGNVIEEIVTPEMTDVEKLDAITSWLQENIELDYMAYENSFNDVIKKKKGTPPLITGLAHLMLEKVGITSDFVLIHSASEGYFDENFVVPGILSIPAIHTALDGKDFVLFPYIKGMPYNHTPEFVQGQPALRINGDGYNGFITLGYGNIAANTVTENYTLEIDEEGMIRINETKEFNGSNAFAVRSALKGVGDDDMEDLMEELLTYDEGDVKLQTYEIINREDYKKPLQIRLEYTIDNLVTVTPEEVILQTGGLLSPSSGLKTKVDTDERSNPIRVYYDEALEKKITIRHPRSWRMSTTLKNVNYENQFGAIDAEYLSMPGETTITLRRTLNQVNETPDKFDEMLDIIGSRSEFLNVPTLIFAVE